MRFDYLRPPKKDSNLFLAFKFVSLFFVLALIAYLALSITAFPDYFAAISSQFALKTVFNLDSQLLLDGKYPIIETAGMKAQIIDLCSAVIEIAIMFGIIFASTEKKLNYRIRGFAIGVLLLLVFNALRISATIYYFDAGNLEWTLALHDFLFRIFLIIILVTYYAIWYYYDQPREKTKRKRKGRN